MTIRTRLGRAVDGDYDHFGLRVYRDLAGSTSYLGLIAFGLTGRRLTQQEEEILDDLAVCSHVPEPRVWPIKITWITGALGRGLPGYISGMLLLDSDLLGGRIAEDAARLLLRFEEHVSRDSSDESVARFVADQPRLHGFGVPVRDVDERLVAFRAMLARRSFRTGRYWALGERLWKAVKSQRGVEVNIIGATVALCLDFGFEPGEIAAMAFTLLQPTFLVNAMEASRQQPPELRRLPDDVVRYVGPAARKSPRAIAAEAGEPDVP